MTGPREAIEGADWLRRSPFLHGGAQGHKEWWHFAAYAPGIDVLVNFSLVDDVRPGAPVGQEFARITALVRTDGWDGDVELVPSERVEARGGGLAMRFGEHRAALVDGVYHLRVALKRRAISITLALHPEVLPSVAHNIPLDAGPPIHWLVVPRCRAHGEVRIDGVVHALRDAPAYHDHNWGHFSWGRDFAWEWGFGLPAEGDNPWSMVFVRLSDRAHSLARMQALFLWRGAWQHRVLRADELSVTREGFLRPTRVLKVPRAMALLSPSTATDVPRRLIVEAQGRGDRVRAVFTARDLAQVVIPNDHDPGNTIINEVGGEVEVEGEVRGERVSMQGRAVFEFLGA